MTDIDIYARIVAALPQISPAIELLSENGSDRFSAHHFLKLLRIALVSAYRLGAIDRILNEIKGMDRKAG